MSTPPGAVRSGGPNAGFSLMEILVALVIMGVVMAMLTPMVLGVRNMVQADQLRTAANQGARSSSDIMGVDIRMAGERFPRGALLPLPPIQIQAGAGTIPDTLILRRNLWEATFPICQAVTTSAATMRVVRPSTWNQASTYPECIQPPVASGWPANLAQARALADTITTDGVLRGYIFDPIAVRGEFFDFTVQDNAPSTSVINRVGSGNLAFSYPLGSRVYILDERRYQTRSGILELVHNGRDVLRVAAGITGLEARYVFSDGTVSATYPTGMDWRNINAVEVTVTGRSSIGPEQVERTVTNRYFPRNVLSR